MAGRSTTRDRQTQVYNFFAGLTQGLQRWQGERFQGSPATVPPSMQRKAQNCRLNGQEINERGGQSKLGASHGDCITGIFPPEFQFPTTPGLIFAHPAALGDPLLGELFNVNPEGVTTQDLDSGNQMSFDFAIEYNHQILIGTREADDRARLRVLTDLIGAPAILAELPVAAVQITSMVVAGSDLLIGAVDSAVKPLIYRWNGTTIALEIDLTATENGRPALGATFGGEAFVGVTNKIYRRTGVGTWVNLALPGGVTNFETNSFATALGDFYIGGGSNPATFPPGQILKWDGFSLVKVREIAATVSSIPVRVTSMASFDNKLYYGWADVNGSGGRQKLGSFDGATWDDAVKDMPAQFTDQIDSIAFNALFQHPDGNLWTLMSSKDAAPNRQVRFARSPGTNIAGTWENMYGPVIYNYWDAIKMQQNAVSAI